MLIRDALLGGRKLMCCQEPLLDIEDNQSFGICGWVVAIVVLILIGYLARAAIRYFSTEFVLTNKRILHKVGWIRRKSFELVLTHVEGIGIDQSAIARALGYGTLVISGSGGSKQSLRKMANPHEFRKPSSLSPCRRSRQLQSCRS